MSILKMIRFFFITVLPFIFAWSQNSFDANGLRDGEWFGFHENGQIAITGQFKNGLYIGTFKFYNEKGEITEKNKYNQFGILLNTKTY